MSIEKRRVGTIGTLAATLSLGLASVASISCDGNYQSPTDRLEPAAVAWSNQEGEKYSGSLDAAREAVYAAADINRDERVGIGEADIFLGVCPAVNNYNCRTN